MKKYFLVFISLFFLLVTNVSASQINDESIKVFVKKDGSAEVTVNLYIKAQKEIDFDIGNFKVSDSKITDIKITDSLGSHYEQVDSLQYNKALFYKYDDQGYKKIIRFRTIPRDASYTITYKMSNFFVKYADGKYGIDWFAFSRITVQEVGSFNASVQFEDIEMANNVETQAIVGLKGVTPSKNGDTISFGAINVDSGSFIRLLVLFNKNVSVKKASENKLTFEEFYDKAKNGKEADVIFNAYFSKEFLVAFSVILEVGLIILVLSYIIIKYGIHDEYFGMEVANKLTIMKPKACPYYDSVPCQGDIYKILFVAGYFKLLRNKSGLLGAILFKMYLNDNIEIVNGKSGKEMRLRNDLKIDRSLDQDLYNIFMEASDMRVVNASKTNKFSHKNFLRIMTWYNMSYSESITDEINRGHAVRGGKVGRTTKIIFNETMVDYGNKILGMKKYLLNFNQVPRQSPLSEDTYKLLLMCAEMLGIGDHVADEILRKNPTNIYAKKLKEFQVLKPIYKDIYATSLQEYRKTVKNSEIYNYDSMKDSSLQSSTNVINVKR